MKKLTQSNKFLVYIWLPFLIAGIFLFNVLYVGWATEFRPAGAGGGDAADGTVTSDGNNIYSGTATFQQTVTISSAQPTFELSDTTASEDDFVLQVQGSGLHLRNEQDSVTYLTVDSAQLLTLGNSTGGLILNGSGGAVSVENATPIFELSDTNADDFLLRANTAVLTLENEADSITYLNIDGATSHNITLGSTSGATIFTGAGGAVSVENATPIFELSDTTGAEDDFLLRAQTSAFTIENEIDGVTYFTAASTHNVSLGSTSGTTTLTSSTSVTNSVPVTIDSAAPLFELQDSTGGDDDFLLRAQTSVLTLENETSGVTYLSIAANDNITFGSSSAATIFTGSGGAVSVENATPIFELSDTTGAEDDFLLRAQTSAFTIENETDAVTYFTADVNHLVTVGSSSGGTLLNGAGGAVSVENATPIFELSDTTGAEDDFLLRAQTSAFTIENETDGVTYFSVASNHNLTLGSASGSTIITGFSPSVVTIDSAISVLELQDSTASEDDYFFRAEGSTLSLRNEQDGMAFFSVDANNDIQIGNSSDSAVVITADSGGIMFGGAVYPRVVTLADAATITWNASQGNHQRVTLAGNRTINGGTGGRDGQKVALQFVQDATGSRTVTFAGGNTGFNFGTDVDGCTLSTGALSSDYVGVLFNAITSLWEVVTCTHGY